MKDVKDNNLQMYPNREGPKPSDGELLVELFVENYDHLFKYMTLYAQSMDLVHIEDILMEAFTRALEHPTPLCEITNLKGWVFAVAKHVCQEKNRLSMNFPTIELEGVELPPATDQSDTRMHLRDLEDSLLAAMSSLSATQQLFFQESWYEHLTNQEIADRHHCAPQYVANQLVIARKRIKIYLQKKGLTW